MWINFFAKKSNRWIVNSILCVFCGVVLFLLISLVISRRNVLKQADELGRSIGANTGKAAGYAVACASALNKIPEGIRDGKTYAQSAEGILENTDVDITDPEKAEALIRRSILGEGIGELEVLRAKVKVSAKNEVGQVRVWFAPDGKPRYCALYLEQGTVGFTVDLDEMAVKVDGIKCTITLPCPEAGQIVPDDGKGIQPLAVYQRTGYTGSTEEGVNSMLGTLYAIAEKTAEELDNFAALQEAAKHAAETQVRNLAEKARVNEDLEIIVKFADEEKGAESNG